MIHAARFLSLLVCLAAASAFATQDNLRVNAITAPHAPYTTVINPNLVPGYVGMLETLPPQQRAERALAIAIDGRVVGVSDYVMRNAQGWRGRIETSDKLAAITLSAMNSPRLDVRMAGFEVQLAMDNLEKTPREVEHLIQRLHEDPHGVGAWELWHLGVLGARGVERERILSVLVATSRDSDNVLRGWAVEALTLFGGVEAIAPLLSAAASDNVQAIRERAFCALAQSGTFRRDERYRAIPDLLAIAQANRSDQQNLWAYRALDEITGIDDVPRNPGAWKTELERISTSTSRTMTELQQQCMPSVHR